MMTQEEWMNVKALHAAGWSIRQIAEHLGYHPATVSGWLKAGGPPPKRQSPAEDLVVDRRDNQSHLEFLAALVAEEASATRNRRLAARLHFAHFGEVGQGLGESLVLA